MNYMSSRNVQRLRQACGGLDKDAIIYGKLFSPIKSCELLVSVEGFESSLEKSEASWIRLASKLLPIIARSEKCKKVFTKLVKLILMHQHLDGREQFLISLWKYLELNISSNNLELMELFVTKEPKFIEVGIIQLFMDLSKNISKEDTSACMKKHWVTKWCSKSRLMFSTSTSIINAILLRSVQNVSFCEEISKFIYEFKCCVAEMCTEINVTNLYPLKYQGLVSVLDYMESLVEKTDENECTDEEMKVDNETDERQCEMKRQVTEFVDSKLKQDPLAAIAILTHYPSWISFLHELYNS